MIFFSDYRTIMRQFEKRPENFACAASLEAVNFSR